MISYNRRRGIGHRFRVEGIELIGYSKKYIGSNQV